MHYPACFANLKKRCLLTPFCPQETSFCCKKICFPSPLKTTLQINDWAVVVWGHNLRTRTCACLCPGSVPWLCISKTFWNQQNYRISTAHICLPHLEKDCRKYAEACITCMRNKSSRTKAWGLLKPLPIPERPWKIISMDFIVELWKVSLPSMWW